MMNNENGRSMVEMLGVLAIIGVLSVAGIAGYTMAMRAYRANEILQGASMLYAVGRAQNGGTGGAILTYANGIGGTIPGNATEIQFNANNTVTITAQDHPDCMAIQNKVGTNDAGVVYASTPCPDNGSTVTLTYRNDG